MAATQPGQRRVVTAPLKSGRLELAALRAATSSHSPKGHPMSEHSTFRRVPRLGGRDAAHSLPTTLPEVGRA